MNQQVGLVCMNEEVEVQVGLSVHVLLNTIHEIEGQLPCKGPFKGIWNHLVRQYQWKWYNKDFLSSHIQTYIHCTVHAEMS